MLHRPPSRRWLRLAICTLALLGLVQAADAARRALVIGNDGYRQLPALNNARADARALAQALEAAGFTVSLRLDAGEKEMKAALRSFKAQVAGGDEAVFFYSGHGVQIGGANYLLPVDLAGDDEEQVRDEAVSLQRVMDDLQEQKARFALAIVDACRDNPFKGKGRSVATRGLAPTAAASGQMIMFSAGTGQQALDRLGDADPVRHGVFTRVLLREIEKPGVSADRLLRNVRAEVVRLAKSVGHEQVPAIYDQAIGDFYFRRGGEAPPAGAPTTAQTSASPAPAGPSAEDIELQAWNAAKTSGTAAGFQAYLAEYPDGRFRSVARIELARLKEAAAPASAAAVAQSSALLSGGAGRNVPAQANPGTRYADLVQVMNCPADRGAYGEYRDYGYWGGGGWCGQTGKAGYWVWVAPNWYVWGRQR